MKVSYEGILWQARQIDDFLIIETADTPSKMASKISSRFKNKCVRVTIEQLPDPKVKADMPVCYAVAGAV